MRVSQRYFSLVIALLMAGLAAGAVASDKQVISRDNPQVMLQDATDRLLDIAQKSSDLGRDERESYYREVRGVLEQVIDTRYFARGVMATYASARLYRSLESEEDRAAFRSRVRRFVDALEQVFIEKYADALLTFSGERIELETLGEDADGGKASLLQTIYAENNKTYKVQYNLRRQDDDTWLVTNVVVEGVNLGATYRNQFADLVEKHGGDVDYVVDNWVSLMAPADNKESDESAAKDQGDA